MQTDIKHLRTSARLRTPASSSSNAGANTAKSENASWIEDSCAAEMLCERAKAERRCTGGAAGWAVAARAEAVRRFGGYIARVSGASIFWKALRDTIARRAWSQCTASFARGRACDWQGRKAFCFLRIDDAWPKLVWWSEMIKTS